jgi:hypothetical protein
LAFRQPLALLLADRTVRRPHGAGALSLVLGHRRGDW